LFSLESLLELDYVLVLEETEHLDLPLGVLVDDLVVVCVLELLDGD
jgi:hypothetical protein